jgi:hypothetical protein
MKFHIALGLGAAIAALSPAVTLANTWTLAVSEAATTAVAGGTNTNLNALGGNGNGLFVAGNSDGTNRKILAFSTASSTVTVIATDVELVAAITAMNGTAADPAASAVRFQGLGFNSNGKIIAFLDGSGMASTLLAIEPTAPHTISVLSTAVDAAVSPVEGGNGFTMRGNIAYMLVDSTFSATEDKIVSVDTSTLVNTGLAPVTVSVGEVALLAASGDSATNNSLNDIKFISNTQAIVLNSGATASNDNLILVDVLAGTASIYVNATDIEADTGGVNDVGYSGLAVDHLGKVYLANMFGVSNVGADDGVIFLSGITPPNATATVDTEAKIVGDLGGTNFFIGADGMFFDSSNGNRVYAVSDGAGNSGLIYYNAGPNASVKDWSLYSK